MRFKKIYLEISNICNLQCSFCPVVEREKQVLELERFRRYLAQVAPLTERVCLHVMGEPLNHPQFAELVSIAQEMATPLEITTNGTLLNLRTTEALLNPTIVQVNFSLQSFLDNFPQAEPRTYMSRILTFCDQANLTRPDLYVNLRLWNLPADHSLAENELFLAMLEEHFHVRIRRQVDVAHIKSKRVTGRVYLHFDTRFSWPDHRRPALGNKGTCYGTRSHVAIHADGKVVPCCLDKEARIQLGHLEEQDLSEIIDNERTQKMRQGFINNQLLEDLCQRCEYISRFS